jgi:stage II sporulation protein D
MALRFLVAAVVLSVATPPPTSTPLAPPPATSAPPSPDLPAPLPPPIPAPDDPLELLGNHRLQFDAAGEPLVTIRIAGGRTEVAFRPRARARLVARGGDVVEVGAGASLRARVVDGLPAALAHHVLLAEVAQADRAGLAAARRVWEGRGLAPTQRQIGGVYGIAGKVVDNRRVLLLAPADGAEAARALAERLRAEHGVRPEPFADVVTPPSGRVEVLDAAGRRLASGERLATLEVEGGEGFELDLGGRAVAYRGRLHLAVDASGRLAAVDAVGLESLLRGLVPSEIPASAPAEALKAQAITARSNVLAQIGTRHLTDPFALCDEVHCQVYRGEGAEDPRTDAAVRATAGEAIFDGRGELVDGVYSAVCGGHGEDNDAVWGGLPSPSLRGRADLPAGGAARAAGLAGEPRLRAFLRDAPDAYCARGPRGRYRWERRFSSAELTRLAEPLGVGRVRDLRVLRRGASGRALALEVRGDRARAVVEGELRIRRLLANLNSAMFVLERDGDEFVLRGGGWGHGAGMCQWGAIGRARAGQGYRDILRAYFAGAGVARVY